MPTYTVTSVEGCLDTSKRAKIASEITQIHSETTGAPTYFAQVIFTEIAPDCYFVGGSPLKGHQVFVNAQIRAGRATESKDSLIAQITAAAMSTAASPAVPGAEVYSRSSRGTLLAAFATSGRRPLSTVSHVGLSATARWNLNDPDPAQSPYRADAVRRS
jgi:phenylpyruvate tautomerase PptA (4-oxalocrotonate tautomerase family)